MNNSVRLLAFSGSNRKASFNQQLVRAAARMATEAGAQVTELDLAQLPIPLFSQDLEAESGLPSNAQVFKQHLIDADGFLIACPEYNSSITPALKNALDWASRKQDDEPNLLAYQGKVAGLLSASPGGLGGMRGLTPVRSILSSIGVHVIPQQVAVGTAHEAFREDGTLQDEVVSARIAAVVAALIRTTSALKSS